MNRFRPWLNFGAGLLIGLSITVALFAAMEESDGRLSQDMLLAALAALVLASVLKLAANTRSRHRRAESSVRSARASGADMGWTVERASTAKTMGKATRSDDDRTSRAARAATAGVPASREVSAADGTTRRL
jgi:hypothetical protein